MFRRILPKLRRTGLLACAAILLAGWTAGAAADGPPSVPPRVLSAHAPLDASSAEVPPGPAESAGELTRSPYFAVDNAEPGVDALPLKSTRVEVRILGTIADVTVRQRYGNTGRRPLEARYVFPGSTRAAVHGLTMRLDGRVLRAKIKEREQARAEYEAGKRAGKTAALLSQHRDNVFQMSVANVLPGDTIDVELRYTELLVPVDGRYQFVFPTVVGPRYNGASGTASHRPEPSIAMPFLREGRPASGTFELNVEIAAPVPLAHLSSPSHSISLVEGRRGTSTVRLAEGERSPADRDFVLDYRLAGDRIQSGVLLHRGDDENFFVAMVEPPAEVSPTAIVPRDYVFVVDVSGSMHGFPLDTARTLMSDLLSRLRPSDTSTTNT